MHKITATPVTSSDDVVESHRLHHNDETGNPTGASLPSGDLDVPASEPGTQALAWLSARLAHSIVLSVRRTWTS